MDNQARRWASEGPPRKTSHRGAKVRAKAKIRESLVSSQDRADASYNGIGIRRDTPQVSPSIPLNPTTPSAHSAPVAYIAHAGLGLPAFVPTNKLMLTGPQQHRNDAALEVLMRRFETASTSAAAGQMGYRPRASLAARSPQTQQPTRRSFLKTAQLPATRSRQSHYWPDYQTWRKFAGPEPETEIVVLSSDPDEAKVSDTDSDVKII